MVAAPPPTHRPGRIEAPLDHVLEEVQAALLLAITKSSTDPLEALKAAGKVGALLDLITNCGVDLSPGEETAIETICVALSAAEDVIAQRLAQGFVAMTKEMDSAEES